MMFRESMILGAVLVASVAAAQEVTRPPVPGATNFARLETTVACGGATTPEAVPEVKKMGFASIINLRERDEHEANIDEEEAAAKAAGITFVNIPISGSKPDPAAADKFLATMATPGIEPAYIHCASGNRAAMMWMIKRLVVDHWDAQRASTEAATLGLTSEALKQFALYYAQSHKR
jgi:uncharacterized protein (TIGR01244 family)